MRLEIRNDEIGGLNAVLNVLADIERILEDGKVVDSSFLERVSEQVTGLHTFLLDHSIYKDD